MIREVHSGVTMIRANRQMNCSSNVASSVARKCLLQFPCIYIECNVVSITRLELKSDTYHALHFIMPRNQSNYYYCMHGDRDFHYISLVFFKSKLYLCNIVESVAAGIT